MFVCVCHAVSDRAVSAAIDAGAETREEVTQACNAGGDCGGCHQMIDDMIEDCKAKREGECPSKLVALRRPASYDAAAE
jgi:bacterioferritin-associated ferredoxin